LRTVAELPVLLGPVGEVQLLPRKHPPDSRRADRRSPYLLARPHAHSGRRAVGYVRQPGEEVWRRAERDDARIGEQQRDGRDARPHRHQTARVRGASAAGPPAGLRDGPTADTEGEDGGGGLPDALHPSWRAADRVSLAVARQGQELPPRWPPHAAG